MIEEQPVTITTQKGEERTYLISKFPATAGREIVTKYPVSNVPKLGDYQQSEEVMLKLMCFVQVVSADGHKTALTTKQLVDNHVPDWETLARLEFAQLEYNVSFFGKGLNSDFFGSISQKAAAWISQTLIPLLAASSQTAKQPSKS